MFHNIVVGLDNNEALNAKIVNVLNQLCAPDTLITLLSVTIEAPISEALQEWVDEFNLPSAQSLLDSALEKIDANTDNIKTIITAGKPVQKILDTAEKVKADLIIVGSNNKSGWDRFFEGSVSQEVSKQSKQSVVIVKME